MNEQTFPGEAALAKNEVNEARRRWRLILVAALAGFLIAMAINNTLLCFVAYFATAIAAGGFAVASGHGRAVPLGCSLLLPVVGPLIVVFLPDLKGKYPGAVLLSRLTRMVGLFSGGAAVEGDRMVLRPFPGFGRRVFDLAGLRLLSVLVPGRFKWRVTSSSQEVEFVSLDLLDDGQFAALNGMLIELARQKAGGVQLIMADYEGNAALIDLARLGRDPGLLEAIARTRPQRLEKLRRWLGAEAKVLVQHHALTAAGIAKGKWLRAWDQIATFQTLTTNGLYTSLTIVLKEAKAGRFTGKMRHLTEGLFTFTPSRKEWYSAELFFWLLMPPGFQKK